MKRVLLACVLVMAGCHSARTTPVDEQAAIRSAMTVQVAAWNRGDIPGFMQGYENSPDTTFVSTAVRKGYGPVLDHYQQAYSNRAQMGTLTFSDLDIRVLPSSCGEPEYAAVTGRFHLQRAEKGAAKQDDGIFSLMWHRGADGWKIVLDHTS